MAFRSNEVILSLRLLSISGLPTVKSPQCQDGGKLKASTSLATNWYKGRYEKKLQ